MQLNVECCFCNWIKIYFEIRVAADYHLKYNNNRPLYIAIWPAKYMLVDRQSQFMAQCRI